MPDQRDKNYSAGRSAADRAYTWKGQLAVGEAGEAVVRQWLQEDGYRTIDVRKDKSYQQDDIDFLVTPRGLIDDKVTFTAEVKTDTYDNDNVFFETHTAEGNPGALFKSRARVWYIYKSAQRRVIEVEPARVACMLYMDAVDQYTTVRYPVRNQKGVIRAWGVRVSVAELTQCGAVVYLLPEEVTDASSGNDPSTTDAGSGEVQE